MSNVSFHFSNEEIHIFITEFFIINLVIDQSTHCVNTRTTLQEARFFVFVSFLQLFYQFEVSLQRFDCFIHKIIRWILWLQLLNLFVILKESVQFEVYKYATTCSRGHIRIYHLLPVSCNWWLKSWRWFFFVLLDQIYELFSNQTLMFTKVEVWI